MVKQRRASVKSSFIFALQVFFEYSHFMILNVRCKLHFDGIHFKGNY